LNKVNDPKLEVGLKVEMLSSGSLELFKKNKAIHNIDLSKD